MSDHTRQPRQLYRDILECDQRMLVHAEASEWERVIDDDAERGQLIRDFYNNPATRDQIEAAELEQITRRLIANNERLTTLARSAQSEAQQGASEVARGRRAISAYSSHSG